MIQFIDNIRVSSETNSLFFNYNTLVGHATINPRFDTLQACASLTDHNGEFLHRPASVVLAAFFVLFLIFVYVRAL